MKQVIAIIRPYLAERLLENLKLAPLEALQVTEVKGFGRQKKLSGPIFIHRVLAGLSP